MKGINTTILPSPRIFSPGLKLQKLYRDFQSYFIKLFNIIFLMGSFLKVHVIFSKPLCSLVFQLFDKLIKCYDIYDIIKSILLL